MLPSMSSTISIARLISAQQPEAALPCPVCAASLKARNLDRHLTDVHALTAGDETPSAALELVGVDRRVFWVLLIPTLLLVSAVAVIGMMLASPLGIREPALMIGWTVLLVAPLAPLALAIAGRFRARLVLDDQRALLRYAFGSLEHEVRLPAALEAGGLWEMRQSAGMHQYEHDAAEDVQVGSYLRLSEAKAAMIIGAVDSTQLAKHWAGPRSGPRRRRWDITLDRISHIKLQYHLAALRLLIPA